MEFETPKSTSEKGGWAETVRELALTGIAALFMTEDSVRNYLKDLKLPKELVAQLIESISKKKEEFYGLLAKEFGQVISKVDLGKEVGRFLQNHRIELTAKISFEPKSGSGK